MHYRQFRQALQLKYHMKGNHLARKGSCADVNLHLQGVIAGLPNVELILQVLRLFRDLKLIYEVSISALNSNGVHPCPQQEARSEWLRVWLVKALGLPNGCQSQWRAIALLKEHLRRQRGRPQCAWRPASLSGSPWGQGQPSGHWSARYQYLRGPQTWTPILRHPTEQVNIPPLSKPQPPNLRRPTEKAAAHVRGLIKESPMMSS